MNDYRFSVNDIIFIIANPDIKAVVKSRFGTPMGNFYTCESLSNNPMIPRKFQIGEEFIEKDAKK